MKYFFAFIFLLALNTGCKPRVISGAELENKLMETMDDYLHKTLQPGTTITIKDVKYYPDKRKRLYVCQFTVNMHFANSDTTGLVAALISNDFKKVERMQ